MQKTDITFEMDMTWMRFADQLSATDMTPDCINCRPNIDGTLDYTPVPL